MATVNHIFPWRDMYCYIIIRVPQEKKNSTDRTLIVFQCEIRGALAHTHTNYSGHDFISFLFSSLSLFPPQIQGINISRILNNFVCLIFISVVCLFVLCGASSEWSLFCIDSMIVP